MSTIDLDFCSKDEMLDIKLKILRLGCCRDVACSDTGKGYHLKLYCTDVQCDLCRLVFDDPVRFSADQLRPRHCRDVLFDVKLPCGAWRVKP